MEFLKIIMSIIMSIIFMFGTYVAIRDFIECKNGKNKEPKIMSGIGLILEILSLSYIIYYMISFRI